LSSIYLRHCVTCNILSRLMVNVDLLSNTESPENLVDYGVLNRFAGNFTQGVNRFPGIDCGHLQGNTLLKAVDEA